ncbi:hypothetical protein IG631_23389 [Alternaria alternata]|nr:hypothetical protein IG631_23389 [Alternaria alternata]
MLGSAWPAMSCVYRFPFVFEPSVRLLHPPPWPTVVPPLLLLLSAPCTKLQLFSAPLLLLFGASFPPVVVLCSPRSLIPWLLDHSGYSTTVLISTLLNGQYSLLFLVSYLSIQNFPQYLVLMS